MRVQRQLCFLTLFASCLFCLPRATSAQSVTTRPMREYVISVGDALDILVWGFPEFSLKSAEVRSDGKITLPMLGDVQAAQLTTAMLKAKLVSRELIGKYITNPNITITVVRSNGQIAFTINGQARMVPRGATIKQVLELHIPTLPPDATPNLSAIKVLGADGEFLVDWNALSAGKAPGMDIPLEWGDQILIASVEATGLPTFPTGSAAEAPQTITFTREELVKQLKDAPQEMIEMLLSLASPTEDGRYLLAFADISEEQREQIGEERLARLFPPMPSAFTVFTDLLLLGIAVDLTAPNGVVAYLAHPVSGKNDIPKIGRFVEKARIEEGSTPEEDMILQEIDDVTRSVIVKKGEELQKIEMIVPSSQLRLSGIRKEQARRTISFSNLPKTPTKKPVKWSFQQGDTLPDGAKIVQVTDDWVLLQREAAFELLLLRDSYQRAAAQAAQTTLSSPPEKESGEMKAPLPVQNGNLPPEMLNALPKPIQALNTFSNVFFATPIIQ